MPNWIVRSRVEFLGCLNDKYNSNKLDTEEMDHTSVSQ